MPDEAKGQRPRVLILGGGFAGVGAAKALKDADVEVVLIDKHDYHTFQPLLYQVATDLLETTAVGTRCATCSTRNRTSRVHQATVTADRPGRARGAVRRDGPAHLRLPRPGPRRARSISSEPRAPPSMPSRCTRSSMRCASKSMSCASGKPPTATRRWWTTAPSTSSSSAEARPAWRARARWRSSMSPTSRRTIRACHAEKARITLVEAGPELLMMFKPKLRGLREGGAGEARRRRARRRDRRLRRADAGDAEVRQGPRGAHARLGGRSPGESARLDARARAAEGQPHLRRAGSQHRRASRGVRRRRHRLDHGHQDRRGRPAARSVALQAGAHAGENIARLVSGEETKPFRYHDKGTMATIGRGAAVVQLPHGRTMKGEPAWLAWAAPTCRCSRPARTEPRPWSTGPGPASPTARHPHHRQGLAQPSMTARDSSRLDLTSVDEHVASRPSTSRASSSRRRRSTTSSSCR